MKQLLGSGYELDKLTTPGEYAVTGPVGYRTLAASIHVGVGHLANGQLYQQAIEYPIDANWQYPLAPVWVRTRSESGTWGQWVLGPVVVGDPVPPEPEGLALYLSSPEAHTQNEDALGVKWAGSGFLAHPTIVLMRASDSSFANSVNSIVTVVDDNLLVVDMEASGVVEDSYVKLRSSDGVESNVMRFSWTA